MLIVNISRLCDRNVIWLHLRYRNISLIQFSISVFATGCNEVSHQNLFAFAVYCRKLTGHRVVMFGLTFFWQHVPKVRRISWSLSGHECHHEIWVWNWGYMRSAGQTKDMFITRTVPSLKNEFHCWRLRTKFTHSEASSSHVFCFSSAYFFFITFWHKFPLTSSIQVTWQIWILIVVSPFVFQSQILHSSSQEDQEPLMDQVPPPIQASAYPCSTQPEIPTDGLPDCPHTNITNPTTQGEDDGRRQQKVEEKSETKEKRATYNRSLPLPQPSKLHLFLSQTSRPACSSAAASPSKTRTSRQLSNDPDSNGTSGVKLKSLGFTSSFSRLPKPKSYWTSCRIFQLPS